MNNNIKQTSGKEWWHEGVRFFYQVSSWIIGPIIIALFLGNYLDKRYNSGSKFLLILVGCAFIFTNIGLITETIRYSKKLKQIDQKKESEDT